MGVRGPGIPYVPTISVTLHSGHVIRGSLGEGQSIEQVLNRIADEISQGGIVFLEVAPSRWARADQIASVEVTDQFGNA